MRLAINLITRNRPQLAFQTAATVLANISLPSTRLMVSIDEDDINTVEVFEDLHDPHLVKSIKPREDDIGSKYNRVLELHADVYCHLADYTPFVKLGFDKLILDAANLFPDRIGVVVNHKRNDSFHDIYAATHSLISHLDWDVGHERHYFPPYFPYWFVDHWMHDIARMIGRIAFAPVTIHYPSTGKPKTQELRDLAFWATFFDAAIVMRRRQALKIIWLDSFNEPTWRRVLLEQNLPIVEQDSKRINDHVRSQAALLEKHMGASPADERYCRVKAAAVEMLRGFVAEMEGR